MTDNRGDEGWLYGWTLSGSLAVHVCAALLLIFGLPVPLPESEQPPVVNVELVPPPEPQEEAKPEPPAPEPPPEPPAPEPEEAEAPPPPPPPQSAEAAERPPEIPVLRPVYQYGEKDAGPADATDGNAAQDSAAEPDVAEDSPAEPEVAQDAAEEQAPDMPEAAPDAQDESEQETAQEQPPSEPAEEVVSETPPSAPEMAEAEREGSTAPQVLSNPGDPDLAELPAEAQTEPVEDLPAVVAQLPAPRPAPPRKVQAQPDLQRAQRIFSRPAVVDSRATVAMGNMPRGVRAGRLCVTELREQLLNGVPPYYPDLLPNLRLQGEGTVLNEPRTEFRMGGQWYNLSVRCTVDANATRVRAFAFRVGGPIPRSEWAARRLPAW